jgi:hypothetical protein
MDEPLPRLVSSAILMAVGLFIALLAVPLIRRRVGPNWLYGLRVRATFADESVWYDANERSGRTLFALGAATIAFGIGNMVVAEAISQPYFLAGILALVVGTIACAIDGWRYANRLLRERAGSDPGHT